MSPTKSKTPRPRTGRGRGAPQLPPIRVSLAELDWAQAEVERLGTDVTKLMRNRFFKGMPGYKPEV